MATIYNPLSILSSRKKHILFLFSGLLFFHSISFSNPADYEARRLAYIDNALSSLNSDAITIQAYKGVAVDPTELTTILNNIATKSTVDFDIVKLIRVLEFTHGEYDSLILPVLCPIPFWLEKNETNREYWSENHMIMWMSSDWLLHEKYGKIIDSTLERRLRHYLQLKVQYGFYEFFSSTYAPYCLSGLLNLADFSQDAEIKDLAAQASRRLLKDLLMLTNDKGVFFPTAGRNYPGKYETAYGQNHNSLIYLLTGLGEIPGGASHSGGFLSTSSIEVSDVINSLTTTLNTVFTIGHTLQNGINNINNTMSAKDKVIFQWSSGDYFHPDVSKSTFQLLKDLNLWGHFEFADFRQYSFLPSDLAPAIAEIASPISKSSGIYNPTIAIFKNKSVTLSSLQDFWKGKLGYQQFPVMANAGTTAVFTLSGKPNIDWDNRPSHNANIHLPYVKQTDNIALVMYRPEKGLALFGYKDDKLDVELHWQSNKFDEIRESGNWLLGRQGDGYVAVRRNCTGEINGVKACNNPDGQTWVFMVGNADMYGSFDHFQQLIEQSQYEEKWYFNLPTLQWVYYSKIVVDGKTIEYAWNGDIFSGPTQTPTAVLNSSKEVKSLTIFPNPATDAVTVALPLSLRSATLSVFDIKGAEIYSEKIIAPPPGNTITISTKDWTEGMYMLLLESQQDIYTQKLLIKR
ncbi:MAG: T9SS type A sorting domain-containing protein [Chitinophagales bacterium]